MKKVLFALLLAVSTYASTFAEFVQAASIFQPDKQKDKEAQSICDALKSPTGHLKKKFQRMIDEYDKYFEV